MHVLAFILKVIDFIGELLRAGEDEELQEQAIMKHAEDVKRELDRRKFGKKS